MNMSVYGQFYLIDTSAHIFEYATYSSMMLYTNFQHIFVFFIHLEIKYLLTTGTSTGGLVISEYYDSSS